MIATVIAAAAVTAVGTATAHAIAVIANRAADATAAAVASEAVSGTARETRNARQGVTHPPTARQQTPLPARNATVNAATVTDNGVVVGVGVAARIAHPNLPPAPQRVRSARPHRHQVPMMQRARHQGRTCLRQAPTRCSRRRRPRAPSRRVRPSPTRRMQRQATRAMAVVVVVVAAAVAAVGAVRTATTPPKAPVRQARRRATPTASRTTVVTRQRTLRRSPRSNRCRPCHANSRR